jgi:hypothetical protein
VEVVVLGLSMAEVRLLLVAAVKVSTATSAASRTPLPPE